MAIASADAGGRAVSGPSSQILRAKSSENNCWIPMSTLMANANVNPDSAGNPTLGNAFGVYVSVVHHEASAGGGERERVEGRESH